MAYKEMLEYWEGEGIEPVQQVVVCAACLVDGVILCGARHWDGIMRAQANAMGSIGMKGDEEQGFIDQFGTFLSRKEALIIAVAAGQKVGIERGCGGSTTTLYSEGLY